MTDDETRVDEIRERANNIDSWKRSASAFYAADVPWLLDRLRATEAERDKAQDEIANVAKVIMEVAAEAEAVIAGVKEFAGDPDEYDDGTNEWPAPIVLFDLLAAAPSCQGRSQG